MPTEKDLINKTLNYISSQENEAKILELVDKPEQTTPLSLFFDFLMINANALNNSQSNRPRECRKLHYLEILSVFDPCVYRAKEIMINFCSEESLVKNRDNIIEYFFECYKYLDYSSAIIFCDAVINHYYLADISFTTKNGIQFYCDKSIKKEKLKEFIDTNWKYISKSFDDTKSWKMNPKILGKTLAEYLIFHEFKPKRILEIMNLIFNDENELSDQVGDSLTDTDIRIYKHDLKGRLKNDWFNEAWGFLKEIKKNNPNKYDELASNANSNLKFNSTKKIFYLD